MADAITEVAAHLPAHSPHIVRVWFVVDATVDTHLLLRIARQPLHKATATSLGNPGTATLESPTQPFPLRPTPHREQESHRHQYGNGKVDNQAVHQRTTHLPALQIPDLAATTHTSNTCPLYPEPHQTPDWVPEDAPYSSHDRAYHYPNPVQHLARVLGDADSRAHIQELQDRLQVPLYHSALRPANVPAHLQKRRIQLLREQLPFLTRVARWLAPQAHPRPRRSHPLPMRPHHPGGLGTLQEMPPPYGQGHPSGLVPGGNPAATRRMASPQPRTPGHRTPLAGPPDQRSHHERGSDTGPAPTPHQTHGKPHGSSSTPPARSGPQSSSPNGTPQTPPANTRGTTHRPHRQGTHAASHPLPCRA